MELIAIIGELLAQKITLSPPAGRGLVKLAIKDEFGPFKSFENVDYDDLKTVISNSLKHRLLKLEVTGLDNLIITLLNELNRNQSLITMSKV